MAATEATAVAFAPTACFRIQPDAVVGLYRATASGLFSANARNSPPDSRALPVGRVPRVSVRPSLDRCLPPGSIAS